MGEALLLQDMALQPPIHHEWWDQVGLGPEQQGAPVDAMRAEPSAFQPFQLLTACKWSSTPLECSPLPPGPADPRQANSTTHCSPSLSLQLCLEDTQDSSGDWLIHSWDLVSQERTQHQADLYFRDSTRPRIGVILSPAPDLLPWRDGD